MTLDSRKDVFDAAKAAGASFPDDAAVKKLDDVLTELGAAQASILLEPSHACAALIQRFEDCAKRLPNGLLQAYPDPGTGGDPWTIGWGSTGPGIDPATQWSQAQADERFARDLAEFGKKVANLIGDAPTKQHQFDAMTSLAYNIGVGAFGTSTLLKKHKAADYDGAAGQFPLWNKGGGRVLAGLVTRRAAEMRLYRGLPA